MRRKLAPEATSLLAQFLTAIGLRPMGSGRVELHFDDAGHLSVVEEHRRTTFVKEDVADRSRSADNGAQP